MSSEVVGCQGVGPGGGGVRNLENKTLTGVVASTTSQHAQAFSKIDIQWLSSTSCLSREAGGCPRCVLVTPWYAGVVLRGVVRAGIGCRRGCRKRLEMLGDEGDLRRKDPLVVAELHDREGGKERDEVVVR